MTKQTIRDIKLDGKTVLVRVDYNLPIAAGKIEDVLRIRQTLPTLRYMLERKCKLVLISHLGRPEGKPDKKYSLAPVARAAAKVIGREVKFVHDCIGPEAEAAVKAMQPGDIILLENLRFHPEEEANDAHFAASLASLGEVYVDDAFAAIHRAHASTVGVTKYLPSVAGLLVEQEVDIITEALQHPRRPLLAVIGGAKVSTKTEVLDNLLKKVDILLVGGAMANTFLAAQGDQVGKSMCEKDQFETTERIVSRATEIGVDLVLPVDVVVTHQLGPSAVGRIVDVIDVGPNDIIVDVGPKTIKRATQPLEVAGTVIWNGPLGITEIPAFAKGSLQLAHEIINLGAKSLIGGGDTAAFVDAAGLHDKFDFVSTGGGASLDLMADKKLPGLEALRDK
jgi:phosphoglycerate kinase